MIYCIMNSTQLNLYNNSRYIHPIWILNDFFIGQAFREAFPNRAA
jgi:hypothetical protein